MLVRRKTNQRPRPLSLKCRKFLKHGLSPKRGFGSLCVIGGFNTAIICTGEESSLLEKRDLFLLMLDLDLMIIGLLLVDGVRMIPEFDGVRY